MAAYICDCNCNTVQEMAGAVIHVLSNNTTI